MSDSQNFGFAKLVPGFDFLQNLAQGASQAVPQVPGLSNWVAPTLNVEEIDKRIQELRAVHFWLEQNTKALSATIQALEVQKMTLATLQGMNCSMADMAQALQARVAPQASEAASTSSAAASTAGAPARKSTSRSRPNATEPAAGPVDPMQWWGSLTQQFQHIAASAMQDAANKTTETARDMAGNLQAAAAAAKPAARAPSRKAPRKSPARKVAPAGKAGRRSAG